jgi:hypothetical protein
MKQRSSRDLRQWERRLYAEPWEASACKVGRILGAREHVLPQWAQNAGGP